MNLAKFKTEMEGQRLLIELMQQAVKVHEYHAAHGLSIPGRLARFVGDAQPDDVPAPPVVTRMIIPPMLAPEAPAGALPLWIWVPEGEAAVTSLVLAWLNQATESLMPARIFSEVEKMKPGINKGSIANLGTRFEEEGVIRRSDDGWTLLRRDRAPVLHRGHLWGAWNIFEKSEAAFYRRTAVKHILRLMPDGLQIMQVTNLFKENCPWFDSDIPASKDLIKMDMRELEKVGAVRRKGRSGKWELTEEGGR
jgi:hypothetical protein